MPDTPISPLAPKSFPKLPRIEGVLLGTIEAGIRYKGRTDLTMMVFPESTTIAGVFTKSTLPGAPIVWCRKALSESGGKARALVVKAGNANVFTEQHGHDACSAIAEVVASQIGCDAHHVQLSATGVIGEKLPYERVLEKLPSIQLSTNNWTAAADAIRTTDTFPKLSTATSRIGDTPVTINGIAKGSGMIEPNMATMLAYVVTDAALPTAIADRLLREANEESFNAITVDSDTSTSDTVLLFATGTAKHNPIESADDKELDEFRAAFKRVMQDLAWQIVRDGEGATKFISVTVEGATDDVEAKRVAKSIANSPLVKTAIAGEDANWGRVVMAIGKSETKVDQEQLAIRFGGQAVTEFGGVATGYDETVLTQHLKGEDIDLVVDLRVGSGTATVWTCDLTHGYISINADYRS